MGVSWVYWDLLKIWTSKLVAVLYSSWPWGGQAWRRRQNKHLKSSSCHIPACVKKAEIFFAKVRLVSFVLQRRGSFLFGLGTLEML